MLKYRGMKLMEESNNGASGEYPDYGAIFMSNWSTRKECLRRGLFGLPIGQADFVKQVKVGMILFLFEFESRELHGVYQACSDGAINIEPHAFRYSGKQFPAQVKFTEMWRCRPLCESEFCYAVSENYFTDKKFNFGLSKAQVQRLLKLFSSKKVERSRSRKSEVAKPTRKTETSRGNTAGDRGFRNRCAGETDGDVDREMPHRVKSAGDHVGRRLTENYDLGDKSDIGIVYNSTKGNEYSRETSEVCRRLVDPKSHGSEDRVGYDFNMKNSFGRDALTNYSIVDDQRVPKNLRHSASSWLKNEYHEKDGLAQALSWSTREKRREADPAVPAQRSVRLESPYETNTEYYDPCNPGIMGDAIMKSSRLVLDAPNVDSLGSASFTANSKHVSKEEFIPVGGYVSDTWPSESVQPFPDEYNGASLNKTGRLGLDLYIPMPTEYPEYQTSTSMLEVACSESESRNGHLRRSQVPDLLISTGATGNMRNIERLSYSSNNIFPSFACPLSSRDLSPKGGVNSEISAYQHQEKFGGRVSYSNDRVVRDSQIYPSFTHPSASGDGVDLYPENRPKNQVQTYQHHGDSGGGAFGSSNRVLRMDDHVNPAELERKRTRKSVFSRLALPSKEERDAENDTSTDKESVDEVMAFLNDCHKRWMEPKRPNMRKPEDFGNLKKKKENIRTREVLEDDLVLPSKETTPNDLLDCEEDMEHTPHKLPFIDFQRRSKARTTCDNPTQGCKGSPEHSASQNKKRKLLRPKLIEDNSEKDGGSNDNHIENVLASQSVSEVPVGGFLGREDQ